MRAYITVWEGDDGLTYRFAGTQADQRSFEKEIKRKGIGIERSEEIDVPTDKAGLLTFLNEFKMLEAADNEDPPD